MKLGKRGIGTKKTHVKQCYQSRHFLQWVMWKSASANICSWRPNSAGIPVRGSRLADVSVLMPGHDNCVILLSGTCARTGTISGQWHKLDPAPDTIRCTERARNFDDIKTTAPGRAPLRWYRGCCTGDAHKFDYIRATAPGRAQIRWYHVPTPWRLFTIRRNCKYATKPPRWTEGRSWTFCQSRHYLWGHWEPLFQLLLDEVLLSDGEFESWCASGQLSARCGKAAWFPPWLNVAFKRAEFCSGSGQLLLVGIN